MCWYCCKNFRVDDSQLRYVEMSKAIVTNRSFTSYCDILAVVNAQFLYLYLYIYINRILNNKKYIVLRANRPFTSTGDGIESL